MNLFKRCKSLVTIVACSSLAATAFGSSELVRNTNFSTNAAGQLQEWSYNEGHRSAFSVETEDDKPVLRFHLDSPQSASVSQSIPVDPADGALDITVRVRAHDLTPGAPKWTGGRFALEFRGADGRRAGPWPKSPTVREDTDGWQEFGLREPIPSDATHLFLQMGVWQSQGTVEFSEPSIRIVEGFEAPTKVNPLTKGVLPIEVTNQFEWSRREFPEKTPVTGATLEIPQNIQTIYVAPPAAGLEEHDGKSAQQPLLSLETALVQAMPILERGQAVEIRMASGIYRERGLGLTLKKGTGNAALLVISGSPEGSTEIRASTVYDSWEALKNNRYSTTVDKKIVPGESAWSQTTPILLRREMVFIDGEPLRQVLSEKELDAGTFFADAETQRFIIEPKAGVDPRSALVEIADAEGTGKEPILDLSEKPNVILRNLKFLHSNQGLHNRFAVRATSNLLVENCTFQWNNSGGLGINGAENVTIRGSKFNHNGGLGIFGWRVRNLLIEDSETNFNNWRGAMGGYTGWSVGGIKLHWVEQVRLQNYRAIGNQSPGFWLDLWCYHVDIIDSHFEDNAIEAAVLLELAKGITIRNTKFIRNAEAIRMHDAAEVSVEDSSFIGNAVTFMVYASKQVPFEGAPASNRGGVKGLYIPNENLKLRNTKVEVEDRPEWQAATEPQIDSFLGFISFGFPPFFHVANNTAESTFYPSLILDNVSWTHPLKEKPFLGPNRQFLDADGFKQAVAAGWKRDEEWRPQLQMGENPLPVQPDDSVELIKDFRYFAVMDPYVSVEGTGEEAFVRLEHPFLGSRQVMFADLALPEGARSATLRGELRLISLQPGEKDWQVPRVEFGGTDLQGERFGARSEKRFTSLDGWQTFELDVELLEGASGLLAQFVTHHLGCVWDIRNVLIEIKK
jgi:hypothetical protein